MTARFFVDLLEESTKFIEDATRLADDVSGNQTFNTVAPLLNFWAAFSPSNEVSIHRSCITDRTTIILII